MTAELPPSADAVVIGAGMIGAAVAAGLAATGRSVCVIDRSGPLGGTTAAGEGNILVSDKLPGPELTLALRSLALWQDFAATAECEFEIKGGIVVAHTPGQLAALSAQAGRQRAAGVDVTELDQPTLRTAERQINPDLPGGAFYPQDCQVQPMLAALAYLARANVPGVVRAEALGLDPAAGRLITDQGRIAAPIMVNAAGPWGGVVARRLGSDLPVRPRRGHILVTEPLPPVIRHKVYECDYVGAVVSDSGALACSAVVESTASGTVLIGSSRDYGGALPGLPGGPGGQPPPEARVLAEIARRAISLFPLLRQVRAIRAYTGYRPACAGHLPVIGPDPSVPGLYHATGHEGAGIGLAPATAELLTALVDATPTMLDPVPFSPARFSGAHHAR